MSTPTPPSPTPPSPTPPSPTPPSSTSNSKSSRIFSEADEIQILKSLIRTTKSIPRPITTVPTTTIDRIINRLDNKFSFSQINDKLRRLRKKYHTHARNKSLVKTHHDRRIFKLSKRIWGKKTEPKEKNNNEVQEIHQTKTENLERFSYLVSEFSRVLPENEVWREKMKRLGEEKLRKMDQEWISLKVEEAKLVAKKAELIQQQIMEVMGENGSVSESF